MRSTLCSRLCCQPWRRPRHWLLNYRKWSRVRGDLDRLRRLRTRGGLGCSLLADGTVAGRPGSPSGGMMCGVARLRPVILLLALAWMGACASTELAEPYVSPRIGFAGGSSGRSRAMTRMPTATMTSVFSTSSALRQQFADSSGGPRSRWRPSCPIGRLRGRTVQLTVSGPDLFSAVPGGRVPTGRRSPSGRPRRRPGSGPAPRAWPGCS